MPSVFGAFGKPKPQPKAPSDHWTANDLAAHDIIIRPLKAQQFFGHDPLSSPPTSLDPALLNTSLTSLIDMMDKLQESTYDVLTYLTWAAQAVPGEETALTDFLGEALQICNFVYPGSSVKTHERVPFTASRTGFVDIDLSIVSPSGLTYLVTKAQAPSTTQRVDDPECWVIEAAVAAFHENNRIRTTKLDMDELIEMEMPAIMMTGTHLTFYLIPVSKALCTGGPAPPATKSARSSSKSSLGNLMKAVTKCNPPLSPKSPGLEDLQSRRMYFSYLLAFQGIAEASCRELRAGLNE